MQLFSIVFVTTPSDLHSEITFNTPLTQKQRNRMSPGLCRSCNEDLVGQTRQQKGFSIWKQKAYYKSSLQVVLRKSTCLNPNPSYFKQEFYGIDLRMLFRL